MIRQIVIIGTGLIGGSIALKCKQSFGADVRIYGVNRQHMRTLSAKENGIIDVALSTIDELPPDADLIILATPIQTATAQLSQVLRRHQTCTIIDVGSTKEAICTVAEAEKTNTCSFIGTHPMAGNEHSGYEYASADLFVGKPWIICPTSYTRQEDIDEIQTFIRTLGAKPMMITSQQHDMLVASASHLPIVVSTMLFQVISSHPAWATISQTASTGMRDTTRLASENVQMKQDILQTNRQEIVKELRRFQQEIDSLCQMLENGGSEHLHSYLQTIKEKRDNWLANRPDLIV